MNATLRKMFLILVIYFSRYSKETVNNNVISLCFLFAFLVLGYEIFKIIMLRRTWMVGVFKLTCGWPQIRKNGYDNNAQLQNDIFIFLFKFNVYHMNKLDRQT